MASQPPLPDEPLHTPTDEPLPSPVDPNPGTPSDPGFNPEKPNQN